MQKRFPILFYEDGEPIDRRCIARLLRSFPGSYAKVVAQIIRDSKILSEETFRSNLARLLPPFLMTRAGAFRGVRMDKQKGPLDPDGVIGECWKKTEAGLREIKNVINSQVTNRSRTLIELSSPTSDDVINKTSKLFLELLKIKGKSGWVRRVGASKVLFAVIPEIALPVDRLEWDHVFITENYMEILTTMTNEIIEWEARSQNFHLDDAVYSLKGYRPTTLPAIYNVLAMAMRPLVANRSDTEKQP
jgi:hypothetical protein